MKELVAQSCRTLCDPMDYSPPGFTVHGILQARILKLIAFPSPGGLPDQGMEPGSPALQADSFLSEPLGEAPIPTLCDPMDYNPPGSSVHGILWSRILMGK